MPSFLHIPKDERRKLDSKSRKCFLLGYGATTKGYRLYDLLKKKVFYSRDVSFNEKRYGVEEPPQPEVNRLVEIQCSPESTEISTPEPLSPVTPSVPETPIVPVRHSERELLWLSV